MLPDRRVPWLLVLAPFVVQFAALAALTLVLRPPSGADGIYSIRFGVVVLGSYAALVGATMVAARRHGDPQELLNIRRTPVGWTTAAVAATFAVALVASLALEPIFHGVREQGFDPGPFPGGASALAGLVLAFLGVGVAGPIAEELYFRGLLQGSLERYGQPVAIVATAVVFGAVHFVPAAFPVLAIYGVLLGLIRSRSRSIVPGMIAHALNNSVALVLALAIT
jgi:membrane protease YdiL (CAAX protease family)